MISTDIDTLECCQMDSIHWPVLYDSDLLYPHSDCSNLLSVGLVTDAHSDGAGWRRAANEPYSSLTLTATGI